MSVLKDIVNMVKKYCDDDVCLMIVFVFVGFSLCYLFKDRISGFANLAAPFGGDDNKRELEINNSDVRVPGIKMDESIGIQLKPPMGPEPTPSTKKALEVTSKSILLLSSKLSPSLSKFSIAEISISAGSVINPA